ARRPSDANAPSDAPTGNSADATSATHLPAVVALSGTETMTAATPLGERLACWLDHLQSLPAFVVGTPLVQRMTEILQRQQRAGSGEHLNADLQLLADR